MLLRDCLKITKIQRKGLIFLYLQISLYLKLIMINSNYEN
jgi:hypothetical protein